MNVTIELTTNKDGTFEARSGPVTVKSSSNESEFRFKKRVETMLLALHKAQKINLNEIKN
jgi:hypothetical protein